MRRICLTNKASQLGDDFVYSYDLCEEFKEKLDDGHS